MVLTSAIFVCPEQYPSISLKYPLNAPRNPMSLTSVIFVCQAGASYAWSSKPGKKPSPQSPKLGVQRHGFIRLAIKKGASKRPSTLSPEQPQKTVYWGPPNAAEHESKGWDIPKSSVFTQDKKKLASDFRIV